MEQIRYRLVINGDTEQPTQPTTSPITIPIPLTPGICNCFGIVTDEATGEPLPSGAVCVQIKEGPGQSGRIYRSETRRTPADEHGHITIPLLQGAAYVIWVEGSTISAKIFKVSSNEQTALLPELIGRRLK